MPEGLCMLVAHVHLLLEKMELRAQCCLLGCKFGYRNSNPAVLQQLLHFIRELRQTPASSTRYDCKQLHALLSQVPAQRLHCTAAACTKCSTHWRSRMLPARNAWSLPLNSCCSSPACACSPLPCLWDPLAAACPCLWPGLPEAPFAGVLLLAAAAVLLLPFAGSHGSKRMLHDSSSATTAPVSNGCTDVARLTPSNTLFAWLAAGHHQRVSKGIAIAQL